MFAQFFTVNRSPATSPRMMFALRERLEEEGLGSSPQAKNLDQAFIANRDVILEEIGPLFQQIDKSKVSRTCDPRFWWWNLDDERVVAEISRRLLNNS